MCVCMHECEIYSKAPERHITILAVGSENGRVWGMVAALLLYSISLFEFLTKMALII